MAQRRECWCGSTNTSPFCGGYSRCDQCRTLVSDADSPDLQVRREESGLYGKEYWFSHQEQSLGYPNIVTRARADLPERCVHWLKWLLRYLLPPAKVMELGCAHGGFVCLMRAAGFDASGLEISPWVCEYARETFGAPMLCGPLEQEALPAGSLNAIVMMDVLEHLPAPRGTLRRCAKLLKKDGLLVIQTPCYDGNTSFEEMQGSGSRFPEVLKATEHLFLFTAESVRRLLGEVGLAHVAFEPAMFPHYDMFLFAGKRPLRLHVQEEVDRALEAGPQARVVRALLDLDEKRIVSEGKLAHCQRDQQLLNRIRSNPSHVVVDLTPMLPGGENGGAKWMTLELLRHLVRLCPDTRLSLLTAEASHEELEVLEEGNVRRFCLPRRGVGPGQAPSARRSIKAAMKRAVKAALPSGPRSWLLARAAALRARRAGHLARPWWRDVVGPEPPDVLFCPFTAPMAVDPDVPVVSVVYDLQYLAYPEFFAREDRETRDRNFRFVCETADRIVCISDFVRNDVLRASGRAPETVSRVHIGVTDRVPRVSAREMREVTRALDLVPGRYLLYPANFWPHKNHEMLLDAFAQYRRRAAGTDLKLVCTGADSPRKAELKHRASRRDLDGAVVFSAFLPQRAYAALLRSAKALAYPSLFEGYGMPVVEAMLAGVPVLCSDAASLPEVAGDAALYFDPRSAESIASAMERLEREDRLGIELVARGRRRMEDIGSSQVMARQYLEVFEEVAARRRRAGA